MHLVLVGGGSLRTLPVLRGIMSDSAVLAGGSIRLVDRDRNRAELVARLVRQTPEWLAIGCPVTVHTQVDRALPGADVVSLVVPVGSPAVCRRSEAASLAHGLPGSDQLSVSGAFRSLTGGGLLRDLARQMERHCPQAWLLCFANPVAVYSAYVNNHTRIRCLGICAGFTNHRWDLTRLLQGRDAYDAGYEVAVAGVNHLSFIQHGTWRGQDLHRALRRRLDAADPVIAGPPVHRRNVAYSLRCLREAFRRHGEIIFSTEGDGLAALFPRAGLVWARRHHAGAAGLRTAAAYAHLRAEAASAARLAAEGVPAGFWRVADQAGDGRFACDTGSVTVLAVHGLAGRPRRVVASRPHGGAVAGFPGRSVLEYSFTLEGGRIVPDPGLAVGASVHGLVGALASHQTLLGDAIAAQDPRIFAQALGAFPVGYGGCDLPTLWRRLLRIHAAEIPPAFQHASEWW